MPTTPSADHSSTAPGFEDFLEGAGAEFFKGKTGRKGLRFGNCAASDTPQKEIEEALTGGGVIENITKQGGLGGFLHETLEASRGSGQGSEEEAINGGVAWDELRRMQVPAFVKALAERLQIVVEGQLPSSVHGRPVIG